MTVLLIANAQLALDALAVVLYKTVACHTADKNNNITVALQNMCSMHRNESNNNNTLTILSGNSELLMLNFFWL